jgi:hypothetical protein
MSELSPRVRLYIAAVVGAGLACSVVGLIWTDFASDWPDLLWLAVAYAISDASSKNSPRAHLWMTLTWVIVLAAILLVGVAGATVLASLAFLGIGQSQDIAKRLFNGGQIVLAAAAGGLAYAAVGGSFGPPSEINFPEILGPFLAAMVVYCAGNGLLVAGVISMTSGVPVRGVLRQNFLEQVPAYLGYGMFGLLLAVLWRPVGVGPMACLLVFAPMVIARWAFGLYEEEQLAYDRTVRTLVQAVETKDLYTRGHSERVSKASVMIARVIGMSEDRVQSLRYAGILHDVGKLGVPTRILQKSERLSEAEFSAIQLHPIRGREMVREIEFLGEAVDGIMHHHERLDGRGYPLGLAGDRIPEFARVIAVADAFDSMTTTRSYRGARSVDEAKDELRRCSGTQLQADLVDALIAALDEHGWDAETEPLFSPPPDYATSADHFDHDDPRADVPLRPSPP